MVIIGLGTNLGDRTAQLQRAVRELAAILSPIECSAVYEGKALLPAGAPAHWDMPFLNMALKGETSLTPRALLMEVKAIERRLGRTPQGHWGPREIDIDILAYGDLVLEEDDLIIPHAGLLSRDFALVPLADVAPQWRYPKAGALRGKTARVLADAITQTLTKTEWVVL